ncbi:hypothetical protein MKW98_022611, partial [Papaver atlanticum]
MIQNHYFSQYLSTLFFSKPLFFGFQSSSGGFIFRVLTERLQQFHEKQILRLVTGIWLWLVGADVLWSVKIEFGRKDSRRELRSP